MANIGIPTKLLAESLGHVITVELKTGQVYRGKLFDCQSSVSLSQLSAVTSTMLTKGIWAYQTIASPRSRSTHHLPARPPSAEDSLSISLTQCTVTHRDGRVTQLDQVYIRGQSVRFFVVPDMLAQAPMFKRVGPNAMKGKGIGAARGKATIMRAQGEPPS